MMVECGSHGSGSGCIVCSTSCALKQWVYQPAVADVQLRIHEKVYVAVKWAGGLRILIELERNTLRGVLHPAARPAQFAVITAPEIEPQCIPASKVRWYVGRRQLGAFKVPASKLLHDFVPAVVREHSLGIQLVWDSLDRNLHFRD